MDKNNKIIYYMQYLPMFLLLCVHPFIVYYKLYESRLSSFAWAPENPLAIDFYLYYKQIFFLIISGIALLFTVFFLFQYKKRNELNNLRKQQNMLVPLAVYAGLIILSSLFSKYKFIAFTGNDGQFESLFASLGYLIIFLFLGLVLFCEHDFKMFTKIMWSSLVLTSLLGILQFTGNNPISWKWVQKLITPKGYLETGNTVTSVFETNRVFLFAYNPNYAGVLLALLSGFCFGMLITETVLWKRILEAILLLCLMASLIGTSSKAGLFTFVAIAIASLIFVRMKIKHPGRIVIGAGMIAVLGIILLFTIGSRLPITIQIKELVSSEKIISNPLEEMVTDKEQVNFKYNGVSFSVAFNYQNGIFDFSVLEGSEAIPLRLSENHEFYYLEQENLEDVTIRPGIVDNTFPLFVITLNGREWMFIKSGQEYFYLNQYLRLETLQNIERFGFKSNESFATFRGLIWSMTLPILKDTLLLGTGADTFACYFPQNNYKDLYYYIGDAVASSRPHSMYLKIAVESGVLSLIALLTFFVWYMLQSVKLYRKCNFATLSSRVGFSCFIAVTIYLVCGLTNDSMITVAPIFWCILGAGMAANRINAKITI